MECVKMKKNITSDLKQEGKQHITDNKDTVRLYFVKVKI